MRLTSEPKRLADACACFVGAVFVACVGGPAAAIMQDDIRSNPAALVHQGEVVTLFPARCGGVDYVLSHANDGWTLTRDGETISEEIDAFLTRALGYFNQMVFLTRLDCGDFSNDPNIVGVTESFGFNVIRRFDDQDIIWLQAGTYSIGISGDRIKRHGFHSRVRLTPQSAPIVTDNELLTRLLGSDPISSSSLPPELE